MSKTERRRRRRLHRQLTRHYRKVADTDLSYEDILWLRQERRKRKKNRHHRKAQAFGGSDAPSNVVKVYEHTHRAFHLLFGPGDPSWVAHVLNTTWLDPDWEVIARRKTR